MSDPAVAAGFTIALCALTAAAAAADVVRLIVLPDTVVEGQIAYIIDGFPLGWWALSR